MSIPFLVEIEMLLFDLKLFEDLSKVTAVVRRGHDSPNLFTEIYYDR